jgi:hypothetical protein
MFELQLLTFSIAWAVVIYAFNALFAQEFIRPKFKQLLLYVTTMAALGILGEVVLDTAYKLIFGVRLWEYRLYPVHDAYTSLFSIVLWGMVGLHIYLLHGTLKKKGIISINQIALIFCVEAIILEALSNLSFLALFGKFIFYYNPGNLWHITSIQALPLYLLGGYAMIAALKIASLRPKVVTLGNTLLIIVLLGTGSFFER